MPVREMCRRDKPTKHSLSSGNHFSFLTQKSRNREGVSPSATTSRFRGENVMRAFVFIITFVLAFGGATVVDTADNLPNAGLFVFNVAPVDAPTVVASR
jgi:hypothetical protein